MGNSAFEGCTNLTSVTIPSSVTKMGHRTLYSEYLCEIYSLNPKPPVIGGDTFCPSYVSGYHLRVYVPEGSISKYKKVRYWERFLLWYHMTMV
ncbi:MAG: leucine-rich repeat domain-containing protein [Bacteroidales bacterium]|nr:leucine-rich repeat domain-containing protein [Bacteroidales bacterium]